MVADYKNWSPSICKTPNKYVDYNRKKYSYALNKQGSDAGKPFIYQKAVGNWHTEFATAMSKLKLEIVDDGNTIKLVDENPNCPPVDGWKIVSWVVLYDDQDNHFGPPDKKLLCEDVIWKKNIKGVDITLITRHGWREY